MAYLNQTGLHYFWTTLKETFARKEDVLNLLIPSTQTSSTSNWTGNAPFAALRDGQTILYHLRQGTSGSASLTLTLSDGSTTGAVPVYLNGSSRVTTQFSSGSLISMTYMENVAFGNSSTKYAGWWVHSRR